MGIQNLKIRRYKAEDNPVVWELHKLGLAEIGGVPTPNNPLDQDLKDIENVYLKAGDYVVGEYDGKVVAMGAFKKIDDTRVELKRMRVHPDYQRRGFGQEIIEELEKRAKDMGYKKMILDSHPKWTKAQNFYKKNGYRETGRGMLGGKYPAIFYEKELV